MELRETEALTQIRETIKNMITAFVATGYDDYSDEYIKIGKKDYSYKVPVTFTDKFDTANAFTLQLLLIRLTAKFPHLRPTELLVRVLDRELDRFSNVDNTDYHNLYLKYETAQKRIKELEGKLEVIQNAIGK